MIKVILTTNFSDSARNAMIYAIQLFGTEKAQYIIMNTFIDSPTKNDGILSVEELAKRGDSGNLQGEIDFLKKIFPSENLQVSSRSVYGGIITAINETVKETGADYAVIGNRVNFDFEASMLRAKTYEMIGKIDCPVLAVPEGREFAKDEGGLIFATDLGMIKRPEKLDPLREISKYHQQGVTAVHVQKPGGNTSEHANAEAQLKRIFGDADLDIHKIENENVLDSLVEFINSNGNSLLVLLARKQSLFKRLTQQSLTREISKLSNMPLLILHDY